MNIPPKILRPEMIRQEAPRPAPANPDPLSKTDVIETPADETMEQQQPNAGLTTTPKPAAKPVKTARNTPSVNNIEKTPESLPVLEAFQSFIESERKNARKRTVMLSCIFITILLCFIASGAILGMVLFQKFNQQFTTQSSQLKDNTKTAIKQISDDIEDFRSYISGKQDNTEKINSKINEQISGYDQDIALLRKTLEDIQKENSDLRNEMANMKSNLPDLSSRVQKAMTEIEKLQIIPAGPATASANILMLITPRGQENAVAWRMPIPE